MCCCIFFVYLEKWIHRWCICKAIETNRIFSNVHLISYGDTSAAPYHTRTILQRSKWKIHICTLVEHTSTRGHARTHIHTRPCYEIGPMTPVIAFERLFFAVFGQTTSDDINPMPQLRPDWTEGFFKIIFGTYLLVSVIVLINLLIAMMSDTYQRIQVTLNLIIKINIV